MKNNTVRVGTRGSKLAMWQTQFVISLLKAHHPHVHFETVIVKTTGDKTLDKPLDKIGDKGLFTRELDEALLEGRIDLAVHSLKDIPTRLPEGLTIGAVPERGDVRDAFLSPLRKPFHDLPPGSTVGTGSLRRKAQLLHLRPDLRIVNVRGNVPTRIQKMYDNQWEGMVLAAAGLQRLDLQSEIVQFFPPDQIVPAVGQGALAVVIRTSDSGVSDIIAPIHHKPTSIAVRAERQFLRTLEGGCHIPIGALGWVNGTELLVTGLLATANGKILIKYQINGDASNPEQLGENLGHWILNHGGNEILTEMNQGE